MHMITSPQNPIVKHFTKLITERAYREKMQSAVILGCKMIQELSKFLSIKTLLLQQDLSIPAEKIFYTTPAILKKISQIPNPEGAIAEVPLPQYQDLSRSERLLILDQISDPGNLGTLIRTAKALGFSGVHLIEPCVDPFNDKAIRAAKGATFTLPLGRGPLTFKGDLYGADMKGTPVDQVSFQTPLGLVLGNESHGISPSFQKVVHKVAIPMATGVESLNVAIAGAICMYQISRVL